MPSKRVTNIVAVAALALAATDITTEAFSPAAHVPTAMHRTVLSPLFAEETKEAASEAAFVPSDNSDGDDEEILSAVEQLGRGAAKVSVFVYGKCKKFGRTVS